MTGQEIRSIYHDKIYSSFINDKSKVADSIDSINYILDDMYVNYKYDYDTYCMEFINYSDLLLEEVPDEKLSELGVVDHIQAVLMQMINNKYELYVDKNQLIATIIKNLENNL